MGFSTSLTGQLEIAIITLKNPGTITVADIGKPVKIVTNETATLCVNNDNFIGIISSVESDVVGVQVKGIVTLTYSGAAITPGEKGLVADGTGYVKAATVDPINGVWILSSNTTANTVTFALNNI